MPILSLVCARISYRAVNEIPGPSISNLQNTYNAHYCFPFGGANGLENQDSLSKMQRNVE